MYLQIIVTLRYTVLYIFDAFIAPFAFTFWIFFVPISPYSAMEEFITRYPHYADFKRMEDENTALHIAASNDKLEVLKYLCSLVRLMCHSCFMSGCMHTVQRDNIPYSRKLAQNFTVATQALRRNFCDSEFCASALARPHPPSAYWHYILH